MPRTLSRWAQTWEREQGRIRCPGRRSADLERSAVFRVLAARPELLEPEHTDELAETVKTAAARAGIPYARRHGDRRDQRRSRPSAALPDQPRSVKVPLRCRGGPSPAPPLNPWKKSYRASH